MSQEPPRASPGASGLVRSAGVVGAATMSSRLLGLVRDQVLAFQFGAGNAMDAFNVAFRIPNLVRDLFAEGAMSAAFVPTFTRTLTLRGRNEAWRLGNLVINGLLVVTGLLVVCGMLLATPLATLFAGEFSEVEGKLELTARLTRILFPFLTLVAVAVAFMGMLNSLHRFFIPALSPAMFNVAIILCGVALVPWMPSLGLEPITAIAIGALLGGFGQIILQWPLLRREGFRYRPVLDIRDGGFRQVLKLMVPGTVGLAAVQINLLVNTVLATGEGTGAVSWLNYAFRIMYLPIGLIGVSVATAALPRISRDVAREDMPALRATVSHALRLVTALSVPAMVGLITLAKPVVSLLFERGRFDAEDTASTAAALCYYAPGLLGYSAVKLAAPCFYALRDSRTPVLVSFASVLVNISLNITLVHWLSYRGLALGTGLAALLNASLLLFFLRRRLGGLEGRGLATSLSRVLVSSAVMAFGVRGVEEGMRLLFPGRSLAEQLVVIAVAIGAGIGIMVAAARILRIQEFNEAAGMILGKLRRRRP